MIGFLILVGYSAIYIYEGLPIIRRKRPKDTAIFNISFFFSLAYTVMFALGMATWSPFEAIMKLMMNAGLDFSQLGHLLY